MNELFSVEQVRVEAVRPLRHTVLRPGQPFEAAIYAADNSFDAQHFAAFSDRKIVGVASIYREPLPHETASENHWRLRGMAVAPEQQNKGCGKMLLREAVEFTKIRSGTILWCRARAAAAKFYLRANFEIIGGKFAIEEIGEHYLMRLKLTNSNDFRASEMLSENQSKLDA